MSKKYKVISLFSGSGGLDLGFLETGQFEILLANDIDKYATETYRTNIGDHVVCQDIRALTNLPKVDVVIGGPPCQGFSTANPNRSFDDPRNWLFKEYARVLEETDPSIFILENVTGITTFAKGAVLKLIIEELEKIGYQVQYKILNAKNYETPQSRRRTIIVGIKNTLNKAYHYPEIVNETKFITVGETIIDKPISATTANHQFAKLSPLNQERIQYIPQGGAMKDCPDHLKNNSDPKRAMRRLHCEQVSPTIVHNNNDHYYHPIEHRRVSIREMARLQGYPDSFVFKGTKSEQSRQVANSVPIRLGYHLGKSVLRFLEQKE